MDLLGKLHYNDYDLQLRIGEIDAGWMDIMLSSNNKLIEYTASYTCDPINELLTKFAAMICGEEIPLSTGQYEIDFAVIEHDLEGSNRVWVLYQVGENLMINVWQDCYAIEDWIHAKFSSEYYLKNHEDIPDLSDNLLMSIKGSHREFAQTLLEMVADLANRGKRNFTSERWGYRFSSENYQVLKDYLENGSFVG